jgi:AraC-like DNA-binding protein
LERIEFTWQALFDADDDARIPVSLLARFWSAAEAVSDDPSIGVRVGAEARLDYFGVLGKTARASATLGDALLKTARYVTLWDESVLLSVLVDGSRAQIWHRSTAAAPRHPCEGDSIMTTLHVLSRELTGRRVVPLEVRFAHAAPTNDTVYREIFDVPPLFGALEYSLVFRADDLMMPIATHDSAAEQALSLEARRLIEGLPKEDTFTRAVKAVIGAQLGAGNPMMENVAAQLGLHSKTLTRRLRQEGTSHSEILDGVRRDLAERYIALPHVSVTDIAFLLGFSDASAFNKAFRRWFGAAPLNYRKRLRSGAGRT